MAGYDWGQGKSNNAVDAEDRGLMTASALAKKLGLKKAGTVSEFLYPSEWHHASSYYNEVDYYDPDDVTPELLEQMNAAERSAREQEAEVIEHCRVEWVEWSGSRRHPHAAAVAYDNVTVTIKGDWANFGVDGQNYRKKLSGNYFQLIRPETQSVNSGIQQLP